MTYQPFLRPAHASSPPQPPQPKPEIPDIPPANVPEQQPDILPEPLGPDIPDRPDPAPDVPQPVEIPPHPINPGSPALRVQICGAEGYRAEAVNRLAL
ncbi:hypothetical protein EHE22_23930 [Ochrobactrum pseudogrignonense]|uniref:Uncharacterized protein n=1 Tax=Brucella pseudogrignonensis TaxID=419475 RepID=A0A7Y3T986_9HYPH|nr:hypothetical protein [Brucella pseudogrignonensis]NNV23439.1 hypothetical protein [Brucella pseudogrignonensis]